MQGDQFQIWTHDVICSSCAPVYPDGCRDVLIIRQAGRPAMVRLTPFDLRPRLAALPAGSRLQGYRLRPVAQISDVSLHAITTRQGRATDIIANDLESPEDADVAVRALCIAGASAAGVARDLGLSLRSLQRLFQALGLPQPDYWRLLARARQAVRLLGGQSSLAAIAAECGFSDQAQLTRELLRWFGQTTRRLQHDGAALALLGQPALGNWTGEQISTR